MRSELFQLRLSPDELRRLRIAAARKGVYASVFVRSAALQEAQVSIAMSEGVVLPDTDEEAESA